MDDRMRLELPDGEVTLADFERWKESALAAIPEAEREGLVLRVETNSFDDTVTVELSRRDG